MRTIDRVRSSSARPASSLRLVSMLGMLALLFVLIQKAGDPATWGWLASDERAAEPVNAVPVAVTPAPEKETIAPGPTDTDPLERAAAQELFQALTDRSTQLSREEMPAYWRLFNWTQHQSFAELSSRATAGAVLDQFVQRPEEQRGKLFRLDLNVRRVLPYDAPANSAGIEKVYEIWGFTAESQAWLYVVLTAELPPGMPIGPNVHGRATFAGYFLKTQGYHAAGSKPNDKSLPAPLLVGRIEHHPDVLDRNAATSMTQWEWFSKEVGLVGWMQAGGLLLGGILIVGIIVYFSQSPRKGPSRSNISENQVKSQLDGWFGAEGAAANQHEPFRIDPN